MTEPAPAPIDLTCRSATCGREQDHGAQVCRSHREQAGQHLAQIGDLYDRLDAVPSMQVKEPNTGSSGALAAHRSVGNLDVMVLRDPRTRAEGDSKARGVYETLAYWAAAVRQARGLVNGRQQLTPVRVAGLHHGPVCAGWCAHDTCRAATIRATTNTRLTVRTERRLLADHLEWIVAQDCAGQFVDEIRSVWVQLRAANGELERQPKVTCRVCGGPVFWRDRETGCKQCGHTGSGLELLRQGAAA